MKSATLFILFVLVTLPIQTGCDDSEAYPKNKVCEWEGRPIPAGDIIIIDVPACVGCDNDEILECDDFDGDGNVEIWTWPTNCQCVTEECELVVENEIRTIYVGTAYLSAKKECCTCSNSSAELFNPDWGFLECTDTPCGDGRQTCEYNGVRYQPGEFGPSFPCDNDARGCLCEVANGQASWKCMKCRNTLAAEENQSATIEGHCCTHLKYGSPAYNSSYLQCVPGPCQ